MYELLKSKNLKITKQRQTILELITDLSDNATIKSIYFKCKSSMNYSTIYRIIDLFIKKGIIDKSINYNNEIYFFIKEIHSHYFTCIKCHKKEKLQDCPIDNINELLSSKGYKVLNHIISISGICKECQKEAIN